MPLWKCNTAHLLYIYLRMISSSNLKKKIEKFWKTGLFNNRSQNNRIFLLLNLLLSYVYSMDFCRGVPFQQEKLWNLQAKKTVQKKSTSQSDLESLLLWFWHLDRMIDTPDLWQMISWVSPRWHPIAHGKEQLSFEFYWLPFSFSILVLYFAVPNILCWTLHPLL